MARPNKIGADYFPECKPHFVTQSKLGSSDDRIRFKAYRSISSGFISKKEVREIILKRDNYKCVVCGSMENLQIDHIISVYRAFKNRMSIDILNSKGNLQTLCKHCNASKAP
ncbi:MAG: HNH endonuclease [Tannerellaceae bacterium]|jgi:5-methylcytosine-specific restriction endonuclease McrA|nr:HNH endonuclease [Tannerellaceae bacterium]